MARIRYDFGPSHRRMRTPRLASAVVTAGPRAAPPSLRAGPVDAPNAECRDRDLERVLITTREDSCARTGDDYWWRGRIDDDCVCDSDCTTAGCGFEICFDLRQEACGGTCDCFAPFGGACGCVRGRCVARRTRSFDRVRPGGRNVHRAPLLRRFNVSRRGVLSPRWRLIGVAPRAPGLEPSFTSCARGAPRSLRGSSGRRKRDPTRGADR